MSPVSQTGTNALHPSAMLTGNPESQVSSVEVIPPLDPNFLSLRDDETRFFRDVISSNDEEVKARILDVQKRSVHQCYTYGLDTSL